ncbi:MAG: phage minor head protein [Allorhizobium sp.]
MADTLPFQEAIDFFRQKVNIPTERFDDVMRQGQVRGFTVAGVTRLDMLADFRAAMERAIAEGTGFNAFRQEFDAIVDRTGWQFRARGETDEDRRDWRARIIYSTNMRTAYMAGRYAQLTDPDVLRYRPYWEYQHSGAEHPRLQHLRWDGLVLAATDPAWRIMFPPNGWGCGCDVIALSRRDLQRRGKDGPDPAPDLTGIESVDPRTGEPEIIRPGIDRGWDYNAGEEWLSGLLPRELGEPLPTVASQARQAVVRPAAVEPVPMNLILPETASEEQIQAAFREPLKIGPEGAFYRDRSGGLIAVRDVPRGIDRRYAGLVAEAIVNPEEIWVDWAQGPAGIVARRSYVRRFQLPGGSVLLIRFEWTSKGFIATTSEVLADMAQTGLKTGVMVYRRR